MTNKQRYNHSKQGVINNTYSHQKSRNKTLTYSKAWFINFMQNNDYFHKLYQQWVHSGYDRNLYPSVDRIDDSEGYTKTNIQLMTFRQNNIKGGLHIKLGITRRRGARALRAVNQYSINGILINTFISSHEAMRQTGIAQQNIGKVCLGKRPFAGGYVWEYK